MATIIVNHPWRVLLVAALMATTAAWYAASNLVLDADTNHLIGADRPFMIQFNEWLEEFGDLEYLYVVVDPGEDLTAGDTAVRGRPQALADSASSIAPGAADRLRRIARRLASLATALEPTLGRADDPLKLERRRQVPG